MTHRRLARWLAALTAVLVVGAAGPARANILDPSSWFGSSNVDNSVNSDIYHLPTSFSGAPGTVLKAKPMTFWRDPAHLAVYPGSAQRFQYVSTSYNGKPIVATGMYLVPSAPWTGSGPRPLVTYAAATNGDDDDCAISKLVLSGFATEQALFAQLLDAGYAVVVTDDEGLGNSGYHPFVNGYSQAHTELDAARAATHLKDGVSPKARVFTAGISAGAEGAVWTAELQPSYAPEVHLAGVLATGTPTDFAKMATMLDGSFYDVLLLYTTHMIEVTHPELALSKAFTASGQAVLDHLDQDGCIADSTLRHSFGRSTSLTVGGVSIADLMKRRDVAAVVASLQPGHHPPHVPVILVHSTQDDIAPYSGAVALAKTYCAAGTPVEFITLSTPTHLFAAVVSGFSYSQQLNSIRDGGFVNQCSAIRSMSSS